MTHPPLRKALSLAIFFAGAALGPAMMPGMALAEGSKESAAEKAPEKTDAVKGNASRSEAAKGDAGAKNAKQATKGKGAAKAKKRASGKSAAKADKASGKSDKAAQRASKTKRATRESKPAPKRAKPAPKAEDSPASSRAKTKKPCEGAAVSFDRGGVEAARFPLLDCHDKPLDSAVSKVSVLARPWGAPKQANAARVDAGVIKRLAAIAKKLPGRTITLVGGPRPTAGGASAHHAGRAVDVRVDGVDDAKLAEVCRSLPDTGCGHYPNAAFVHVDVRAAGSGKVYWIDAAEPGEAPRYVSSWPPPGR